MRLSFLLIILSLFLFSGCMNSSIAISEPLNETFEIHEGKLEVVNTVTEHEKVHDGEVSRFWSSFTVNGGSSRFIKIDIAENDLHFKERDFVISNNNAEVYYKVYIDSTATGGTLINNIYNSNTNVLPVDITTISLDPIITLLGGETDQIMIPDTNRAGAGTSEAFEWMYKANTTLIVEIENTGNQIINVNLRYKWYID